MIICDITGAGMHQGYADMFEEAYEDGFHLWTEWEDER